MTSSNLPRFCCFTLLTVQLLTTLSSCAILPVEFQNKVQPKSRLSLADSAEWTAYDVREPNGPGTYSFGYDVEDANTGNVQFRTEERGTNGTVTGSYGYVTPEGSVHVVHYVADQQGYRAKVEEGGKIKLKINQPKQTELPQKKVSPQMLSALQSLENFSQHQKEDQHIRPISQKSPNVYTPYKEIKKDEISSANNVPEKKNNYYSVYYVPSNIAYH